MFLDKIQNPWALFKLMRAPSLAKSAFLFVIENYNAFAYNKKAMLDLIAESAPDAIKGVAEQEIAMAFDRLIDKTLRKNEILSPAELVWARQYCRDHYLFLIETGIYFRLLISGEQWGKMRKEYAWTLQTDDREALARKALKCDIPFESKERIAEEFGLDLPAEIRIPFLHLLLEKKYAEVEKYGEREPEAITDAIVKAIVTCFENWRLDQAMEIAERFMSDDSKALEEAKTICDSLKS